MGRDNARLSSGLAVSSWDKIPRVMTDDHGRPSAGRWMAVSSLAIAAVLALAPALGFAESADNNLVLYFLLAAFGGKVGQKFAENFGA